MKRQVLMIRTTCFAVFWFISEALSAQADIINSTGQSATVQDIQFSWSVGEMTMVQTYKQADFILTQGFLQNTILTVVPYQDISKSTRIRIYPNPFSEQFTIELDSPVNRNWMIQIKDLLGHPILVTKETPAQKYTLQSISMPAYGPGIYQLIVSSGKNTDRVQYSQWILKL